MCGEQLDTNLTNIWKVGSPPRVRGTAASENHESHGARITPACAGNRPHRALEIHLHRDHPRVCGEQTLMAEDGKMNKGSPPRVRGTESANETARVGQGITPACAGNSEGAKKARILGKDHPRVCGEQSQNLAALNGYKGSPPRVRGTEKSRLAYLFYYRITPACAGNSAPLRWCSSRCWDHPRVCGEQCL